MSGASLPPVLQLQVCYSITIRQHKALRALIEVIPEGAWTPIPYWIDVGADVAEATHTPSKGEKGAVPVRPIVRRVRPTPGSQLIFFATHDFHAFITDRDGRGRLSAHRSHQRGSMDARTWVAGVPRWIRDHAAAVLPCGVGSQTRGADDQRSSSVDRWRSPCCIPVGIRAS